MLSNGKKIGSQLTSTFSINVRIKTFTTLLKRKQSSAPIDVILYTFQKQLKICYSLLFSQNDFFQEWHLILIFSNYYFPTCLQTNCITTHFRRICVFQRKYKSIFSQASYQNKLNKVLPRLKYYNENSWIKLGSILK